MKYQAQEETQEARIYDKDNFEDDLMTSVGRGQARDELRSEVRDADVLLSGGNAGRANGPGRAGTIATLPNDLAQYVVEDNEAFQKEIVEFYV